MNYAFLNPKKPRKHLAKIGFGTFDIETKDGLLGKEMYCWSCAIPIPKSKNLNVLQGFTIESLSSLFKFFNKRLEAKAVNEFVIFVHNLGFDIRFIEEYVILKDITYKPLISGSNVIGYVLEDLHVRFVDSYQFLFRKQETSEIEWNVNPELRKIHCNNIFKKPYSEWSKDDKQRVLDHNRNDVLALHEIMSKFRAFIFEIGKIDMLNCYTIANLGLKIFRTTIDEPIVNPYLYFDKKGKQITYSIDKEKYYFAKKSYNGGRNEVFDLNYHNDVVYVDKVSMFPFEMYNEMPKGIPHWCSNEEEIKLAVLENHKLAIVECNYKPPKNLRYPVLPNIRNGKLCFTNEENHGTYCIPEILYALEVGYEIEFIKALIWDESKVIFKSYVDTMYSIKQNQTGGRKQGGKILLNAVYGKFGQSIDRDEPIIIFADTIDEFIKKVDELGIENEIQPQFSEHFQKYYFITNKKCERARPFQIIHLSSFITSYGRVSLVKYMHKLEKMNIPIYYCDTDSVAINFKHLSKLTLSHEIGSWDIEEKYDKIRFLAPKGYFGLRYVSNLSLEEIKQKLKSGWNFTKNRKAICIIKLKGVPKTELNQIIAKCNTLKGINKLVREPIQLIERYDTFKSSLRHGFALRTRTLTKHYSFEFYKRKVLSDLTTVAWV